MPLLSSFNLGGSLRRLRLDSKLDVTALYGTKMKSSHRDSKRSEGSVTFNTLTANEIAEQSLELDPVRDAQNNKRSSKSSTLSSTSQSGARRSSFSAIVFRVQRLRAIDATEEMIKLDTHLQNEKRRRSMVQTLLGCNADYSVKIRFCSAVDQLELVEDSKERETMVDALIELFLTPGSMFFIDTVSKARTKAIIKGQNELLNAKLEVLEELSQSTEVMTIVNRSATNSA